jgi:hypothetical protein
LISDDVVEVLQVKQRTRVAIPALNNVAASSTVAAIRTAFSSCTVAVKMHRTRATFA